MGRIKEISRKSAYRRKRNPVVYLICEGTETEIDISSDSEAVDAISILYRFHHNTKLQTALSKRVRSTIGTNPYYPDEGDMIWCVFDRDENSDGSLQKAKQTAMREGYRLAYSNPSFELWFLLHFVNQKAEIADCQSVIRMLKQTGRLERYEKSQDVYDQLKPLQESAIRYAKERVRTLKEEKLEIICRQSNPVTTVADLVEYLNSRR